jgi:hypothetical protein
MATKDMEKVGGAERHVIFTDRGHDSAKGPRAQGMHLVLVVGGEMGMFADSYIPRNLSTFRSI